MATTTIPELITLFDNGSYLQFLEQYSNVVTSETEDDRLITAKGISYLRIGEPEKAIDCFNILLKNNSNNKEAIIYKTCKSPLLCSLFSSLCSFHSTSSTSALLFKQLQEMFGCKHVLKQVMNYFQLVICNQLMNPTLKSISMTS